jgi:phospholipase/carboxylesterase
MPLRYVLPHAPVRPVTINSVKAMRAWYDIFSHERGGPVDEDGIRASGEILNGLIRQERDRGVDAARIVVAGFSQGGAIALYGALRFPEKLAGLMALSTYLPLADSFEDEVVANDAAVNGGIPIFMAHGTFDPVVPMHLGSDSAALLTKCGFTIEWHDYPMAHAVCGEEIEHIREWLLGVYAVE